MTHVNMFIYGPSGVGKTMFVSSAQDYPDTSPLLIIEAEGGMATLRKRDDIDVKPIRSREELVRVYETLYRSAKKGELQYKTVAVDTFSEIMKADMVRIMQDAYSKNPDKVNIEVPSPREWGIYLGRCRMIVRAFRDLPCNVIFTAHTSEKIIDMERNIVSTAPNIQGQGVREIPGFFDIVGYYRMAGQKRIMQFTKTEKVEAKDRFSALGDTIENPSIALLWEKIHE